MATVARKHDRARRARPSRGSRGRCRRDASALAQGPVGADQAGSSAPRARAPRRSPARRRSSSPRQRAPDATRPPTIENADSQRSAVILQLRMPAWSSRTTAISAHPPNERSRRRSACWEVPDDLGVVLQGEGDPGHGGLDLSPPRRPGPGHVATRSRRRETDSRLITENDSPGSTSATSSRERFRLGGVDQELADPAGLLEVVGAPRTMTSKTFCSSKRLPTFSPLANVVAARRMSPGLRPWRRAAARSPSPRGSARRGLDPDVGDVSMADTLLWTSACSVRTGAPRRRSAPPLRRRVP